MSVVPLHSARVSEGFKQNIAVSTLRSANQQLAQVQTQLATGIELDRPSADPAKAAKTLQLQARLERREQYLANIGHALGGLSQADTATAAISDQLLEAHSIALTNVDVTSNAENRAAVATQIDSIIDEIVRLGNTQFLDTRIFAGQASNQSPFVGQGGGVRYVGNTEALKVRIDAAHEVEYMLPGSQLLGALSSEVKGRVDLTPALTVDTRIEDLYGLSGDGIPLGSISIIDGATVHVVDLTAVATAGDIVDAINAQTSADISASVGASGITISSTAVEANLTVQDGSVGKTATELGIAATNVGGSFTGASPVPVITNRTLLTNLQGGGGFDMASGLIISNGTSSATVDTSTLSTVGDLLNSINGEDLGVRASINNLGNGIDLVNTISGINMTIGENGGTTATDLGIRSFDNAVQLSSLNAGTGVNTVDGDDIRISLHDGTTVDIDLDLERAPTIGDVVAAINAAGGGSVTVDFNPVGNGIRLTDNTAGGNDFTVTDLGFSGTSEDLGINLSAGAGNEINGTDVNPIDSDGVISHLIELRDALLTDDSFGITAAAEKLDADYKKVVTHRSQLGAKVQSLESRHDAIEDSIVESKALISQLRDVDFTEAIVRFQILQSMIQATIATTGQSLQTSLLDFLG